VFTTVVANSSKKLVYVSLSNTTVPTNAKRIKTEGGMAGIVRIMCVKVAADYMRYVNRLSDAVVKKVYYSTPTDTNTDDMIYGPGKS
jgi:hypothetical protein